MDHSWSRANPLSLTLKWSALPASGIGATKKGKKGKKAAAKAKDDDDFDAALAEVYM